jgi:hypothetical protein
MKGERPSVFVDWLISGVPQLEAQGRNQCPMLVSTIVRVHKQSAFCVWQARIQSCSTWQQVWPNISASILNPSDEVPFTDGIYISYYKTQTNNVTNSRCKDLIERSRPDGTAKAKAGTAFLDYSARRKTTAHASSPALDEWPNTTQGENYRGPRNSHRQW